MFHFSGSCFNRPNYEIPIPRYSLEIWHWEAYRRCNSEKWYTKRRDILDNESICQVEFETIKYRWNHMHRNVEKSVEMSLNNLGEGIEYIDLLLLHCTQLMLEKVKVSRADCLQNWRRWNYGCGGTKWKGVQYNSLSPALANSQLIIDHVASLNHLLAWKDMEAVVATGKVRSIGIQSTPFNWNRGVSNFNKCQLQRLLETAKILPAVNQIEIHPYKFLTGSSHTTDGSFNLTSTNFARTIISSWSLILRWVGSILVCIRLVEFKAHSKTRL